jgi:hypothetical protein
MASSRRRPAAKQRRRPRASPARRASAAGRAPPSRSGPPPRGAEAALLVLARELQSIGAGEPSPRRALATALEHLARGFASDAPLATALAQASLPARRTKTAALALAWAREQVRLGLEEMFVRVDADAPGAPSMTSATRAWLALAACEALAREPREAAADRLQSLIQWATGARA